MRQAGQVAAAVRPMRQVHHAYAPPVRHYAPQLVDGFAAVCACIALVPLCAALLAETLVAAAHAALCSGAFAGVPLQVTQAGGHGQPPTGASSATLIMSRIHQSPSCSYTSMQGSPPAGW